MKKQLSYEKRWEEEHKQREYTFQCGCPGTMCDWAEEKAGENAFMKIAHSAILTKIIQCLKEWEKTNEGQSPKQITQKAQRLTEMVNEQLRELEKFETENTDRHCDVNIWTTMAEYGWARM